MLDNYIPSYDFTLFKIPWISSLQAQEYGAETTFRANTPLAFVDYSLSVLQGLLDPNQATAPFTQTNFFQTPQGRDTPQTRAEIEAEVEKRKAEFEKSVNIFDILRGRTVRSGEGTGPIVGSQETKSIDDAGIAKSKTGEELKKWFDALPAGSGVFLIAVAVVILLLLFVRK
jgi:hypothetical protein